MNLDMPLTWLERGPRLSCQSLSHLEGVVFNLLRHAHA